MPCTLARPDVVGWRMRCVVVIGHVFVRWMVMRLMDFRTVRLLMVFGRTYVMPRFGARCLVVIRMLLRSLVTAVISRVMALRTTVMFVAMRLRTAVMVVIVSMLCVRRSACC
jgi:hypothetical protein